MPTIDVEITEGATVEVQIMGTGPAGVSPDVSVASIAGGHRVSVTDAGGTETFDVMDGVDGQDGAPGADGQDGQDGADGVGVPSGGTTGQVLKKKSGTDYDTEWADESGGGSTDVYWCTYGTTTNAEIEAAQAADQIVMVEYNSDIYRMVYVENGYALFNTMSGANELILECDSDTWSSDSLSFGSYSKPSGGIPKADLASGVQTSLGKADSALQSAPVTSVNSKTGAVSLGKSDVGLGNVDNVQQYSATNPPPYPVTSVNSQTGAVTVSVPSASSATPQALGTATAGTSSDFSRADHVHAKPSASDVGAIATPSSPSVGDFLVYTSDGWDAVTLAEWTAGSY